jgi:hypothetical protein
MKVKPYMRASRVKTFFRDQHFFSSYFQRSLARAQFCIDGPTDGSLLGRAERSTPVSPEGLRRKARGVDGESARRATMVSGHFAAYVTAFLLILFPS